MDGFLKTSTTATLKIGPFVDSTDGDTIEDGLTIAQADVRLSKNGANMAQKNESTSCTHDELGMYNCPIDGTDTAQLGILVLNVHESGALPVKHTYVVLTANAYDSLFAGDKLDVSVVQWLGTAVATPTVAGVPEVDVTHIEGVAEGVEDAIWNAARSSHTTVGSFGEGYAGIVNGAAVTGTLSTTQMTTNLSEVTDDHYIGRTVIWLTGALTDQAAAITDYDGASKMLTFSARTEAPADTDKFVLV